MGLLAYWLSRPEPTTLSEPVTSPAATVVEQPAVEQAPPPARFVGTAECRTCHVDVMNHWQGSHHFHAMEPASSTSVKGDFDDARFSYFGRETRFLTEQERFVVRTENLTGAMQDFVVAYTLGIEPLQQYLVEFDDGRIQALPFAWDTRPPEAGGQRWFHLYPDTDIKPDDPLFWMRPLQNWNHMCADCHTTQFRKNHNHKTNTFDSQWLELGAGCESCHGPASNHLQWAQGKPGYEQNKGFELTLNSGEQQLDQCGVCHARRQRLQVAEDGIEKAFHTWQPELLYAPLYHDDGQIRDEVFVAGSFMQSKMHSLGVKCSDCHNPHSLQLKQQGNALCSQCHAVDQYDTAQHHFHPADSPGAQCVNCHMPETTYMVVDPRRDHRLSIPRPDLTERLGVPNACERCHSDKSAQWAAQQLQAHFQHKPDTHFAEAFHAARQQQGDAQSRLLELLASRNTLSSLTDATALAELGYFISPQSIPVIEAQLQNPQAALRVAAVRSLEGLPLEQRLSLLLPLLHDDTLAVRLEVAASLQAVRFEQLDSQQQAALKQVFKEYKQWLLSDSDRAQARVRLANFYWARGDLLGAQNHFEQALVVDEKNLMTYLNYADYYRALENDSAAEQLLLKALAIYPDSADVHHVLGLLQVRTGNTAKALEYLEQAYVLGVDNSQYLYVFAVAKYSTGDAAGALELLEQGQKRFPGNEQILMALVSYRVEGGDLSGARQAAERLLELAPWNTEYQQMVRQLGLSQSGNPH